MPLSIRQSAIRRHRTAEALYASAGGGASPLVAVRLIIVRCAKRAAIAGLERKMRVCTTGLHVVDPRPAPLAETSRPQTTQRKPSRRSTAQRSLRHSDEK